MIRRFRVKGYKSLVDVDVELSPLTVVFGPNAAGKSNLLDAIDLLGRIAAEPTLDAAFARHRGTPLEAFTFGTGGLEELVDRAASASFTFSVDVELPDAVVAAVEAEINRAREGLSDRNGHKGRQSIQERRLRYTVTIEVRTSSGHLRVMNERVEALRSDWTPKSHSTRRPFLELDSDTGRLHVRMERQAHPIYEDVGQDRTVLSKNLYAPHYPHLTALREEMSRWRVYFLEPVAMREEVPLREVDVLGGNGADVAAFYNTVKIEDPRQFANYERSLRALIPGITGMDVSRTPQGFLRLVVSEDGMPLSARLISEGTLRVLGLLAIANPRAPLSVVGFEEPENGIHPRRLDTMARVLLSAAEGGATQFVVNTHSTVLPTLFEVAGGPVSLLACRKVGRATMFEPFDPGPLFRDRAVEDALDEAPSTVGERMLWGDFGG